MTKDAAIDVVHKTIYGFFDVVADDSEEPMSERDKLLLEVNKAVCNAIKDMPEERKTGRWIEHDDFDNSWECSACNEVVDIIEGTPMDNEYRFCPWCGAKMEGAE